MDRKEVKDMCEIKLCDIDSEDFIDLIDSIRVNLRTTNAKYQKLQRKVNEIMENYPNLRLIFEDNQTMELNEKECSMLQKLMELYMNISEIEEQQIFFLGGRQTYFYFKSMKILKE